MIREQYGARYHLLDGSPRELWPIYAQSEKDATEQALRFVQYSVSKAYTEQDISIRRT